MKLEEMEFEDFKVGEVYLIADEEESDYCKIKSVTKDKLCGYWGFLQEISRKTQRKTQNIVSKAFRQIIEMERRGHFLYTTKRDIMARLLTEKEKMILVMEAL